MNPLVASAFAAWEASAAKVNAAERAWQVAAAALREDHPSEPMQARLRDAESAERAYYAALSSYFVHVESHRRFLIGEATRAA